VSCRDLYIIALTIPVFLVVERSSFLDLSHELLTEIVELLEECHTVLSRDTYDAHILDRDEYGRHDRREYHHTEDELDHGKSFFTT
jgi:hypothetical protein